MIRGDASLAYQDLADVLSACDEAGIRNVRLPVRSRDEANHAENRRDHDDPRAKPRDTTRLWRVERDAIEMHQCAGS